MKILAFDGCCEFQPKRVDLVGRLGELVLVIELQLHRLIHRQDFFEKRESELWNRLISIGPRHERFSLQTSFPKLALVVASAVARKTKFQISDHACDKH